MSKQPIQLSIVNIELKSVINILLMSYICYQKFNRLFEQYIK